MKDADIKNIRCSWCGEWTAHRWGLPTYNGDLISNDFSDKLWAEGGGSVPACQSCFDKHAAGQLPTCDDYYLAADVPLIAKRKPS